MRTFSDVCSQPLRALGCTPYHTDHLPFGKGELVALSREIAAGRPEAMAHGQSAATG